MYLSIIYNTFIMIHLQSGFLVYHSLNNYLYLFDWFWYITAQKVYFIIRYIIIKFNFANILFRVYKVLKIIVTFLFLNFKIHYISQFEIVKYISFSRIDIFSVFVI